MIVESRLGVRAELPRLFSSLSSRPYTREGGWESRDLLGAGGDKQIPDESPRNKSGGLSGMTPVGD